MTPTRTLGPFGGLVSAVDPGIIPEHCAQDMLNMTVEDGKLKLRRSYRQVAAWDNTITACYGLGYLLGFDASNVEQEEFVTVVTKSGSTRAYSIHPTTGAFTVLTNGGSGVTLDASPWMMLAFGSDSYFINPSNTNPVYKHTIGTANSFAPLTNAVSDPAGPFTYTIQHSASAATGDAYDQQTWAGITAATAITNASANVSAASSSVENNNIKVAITSAATGNAAVSFDITHLATKDYQYNDKFIFQMSLATVGVSGSAQNELNTNSIDIKFYNGSTALGASVKWHRAFQNGEWTYWALVSMENVTRSDRTNNITRVRFSMTMNTKNPWLPLSYLTIYPYWVGMVDCSDGAATAKESYAYSDLNSAQNDESGLYGAPTVNNAQNQIDNATLQGFSPFTTRPDWKLGVWVKWTITASSDTSVDKNRLYVADRGSWRRFAEIADGGVSPSTTTTYYRYTKAEKQTFPVRTENQPGPFPSMVWAFSHKGHMVWLRKGGQKNVVHSGVGEPERLPSNADLLDDLTRPGEYSLGDNYAEEPVSGASAGGVCFIAGNFGVYTQIGDYPSEMTPLRRVAGSKGILNKFAQCVWRDENGNPGWAFATRDGIFFISAAQDFQGENDPVMTELSADVRNRLGADILVPVKDDVRMFADENSDALWVTWSNKAYVLRRPSLVDSLRRWEYYEYRLWDDDTALKFWATPNRYGPRCLSNVGHFLEFEFDSANNVYMDTPTYQFYEGDEAPALPGFVDHYWQSKDFPGLNRRVMFVQIDPITTVVANGAAPKVTVMGVEGPGTATQSLVAGTGRRTINFGPGVQGRSLSYKLWQTSPTIAGQAGYEFNTVTCYESSPLSPRRTR